MPIFISSSLCFAEARRKRLFTRLDALARACTCALVRLCTAPAHLRCNVMNVRAFLCLSCMRAAALYVVVERAKKCLDFGSTLYCWHIFFCFLYDGLPSAWEWSLSSLSLSRSLSLARSLSFPRSLAVSPSLCAASHSICFAGYISTRYRHTRTCAYTRARAHTHTHTHTHTHRWTCTIGACVVSIVVGEYVCARREMREITIVRGV